MPLLLPIGADPLDEHPSPTCESGVSRPPTGRGADLAGARGACSSTSSKLEREELDSPLRLRIRPSRSIASGSPLFE